MAYRYRYYVHWTGKGMKGSIGFRFSSYAHAMRYAYTKLAYGFTVHLHDVATNPPKSAAIYPQQPIDSEVSYE